MKKIRCSTLFDITVTGVDNHNRTPVWPYTTRTGLVINNQGDLLRARNQQRNFDTIMQLLSMRTQVFNIEGPFILDDQVADAWGFQVIDQPVRIWTFTFDVETDGIWEHNKDELYWLRKDSEGVPMLLNLTENVSVNDWLESTGPNTNIVYALESDK